MKKVLSTVLAIVMIISCFGVLCFADEYLVDSTKYAQKYAISKEVIKGNDGKTVYSYTYDSKGNLTKQTVKSADNPDNNFTETFTYDKSGRKTKEVSKDADGLVFSRSYTYNSAGNLTKKVLKHDGTNAVYRYKYNSKNLLSKEYFDGAENEVPYERSLSYNSRGQLTKDVYGYEDTTKRETTKIYDSNGNKIKETYKNTADNYSYSDKYTYDSLGYVIKDVYSNSDGDNMTYSYTYDNKGNITKESVKDSAGVTGTTKYTYDSKGRTIKEAYKKGKYSSTQTYSYDSKGNLIKDSYKTSEDYFSERTSKFDSKGNVIKETYKDSDGSSSTYLYEYDSKGRNTKFTVKSKDYSSTNTYKYDSNGNLVKETFKDSSDEVTTYEFSYVKRPKEIANFAELDAEATLSYVSCTYDGKAKKPLYISAYEFSGADYTIKYSNNVKPGKGRVALMYVEQDTPSVIFTFDIKPVKPTGLNASSTKKTSTALSWDSVYGAKKYIVYSYNAGTSKYTKLTTVTTNKATITGLSAGTAYKFCVKAVASGSVTSDYSSKLVVTTKK